MRGGSPAFIEHDRPAESRLRGFENEKLEMSAVVVGRHTPFLIVIIAQQLIVGVDPGTPFWLHIRHVSRGTSPLCCRACGCQRGEFFTPERRASDAPSTFGRFGQQDPRALGL